MTSRAKQILYICTHCTAGFGNIESIERFWKNNLGWKGKGYSIIIDMMGAIWYLSDNGYTTDKTKANFEIITNGVKGFNSQSIHIAYIGGVDPENYKKAKDTRTPAQKRSLLTAIYDVLEWLDDNDKDITQDLAILGHRDFSKDKNGNGVIEPWERIKECPSYPAMDEYKGILDNGKNKIYNKLPNP